MKIRKVKLLYTLKVGDDYIPGGVYDVDSPQGIPDAVLKEVERNRSTVQVLAYDEENTAKEKINMIDNGSADLTTTRKRSRRKTV